MADPVEGPATSTGPNPGGVHEDESVAPGGDSDLGEDATRQGIDAADEAD